MITANFIFILIIVILVAGYIFETVLSWLNVKHSLKPIPALLQGIYDDEKYTVQQSYLKANYRFSSVSSLFGMIVILAMLFFDGFFYIDTLSRSISSNTVVVSVVFFGLLAFGNEIVGMPFDIYHTFIIEKKFGFNKTTAGTYITDKIKSLILSVIIGGGLIALVTWIYYYTESYFWILTWLVVFSFSIIMNLLYSDLIVPLFNKQKPLEEGELKDAIDEFAIKTGFSIKKIMVIDGSKRSTKANAYFSGFGPRKRVVLYDTLITEMKVDEIVAVLAHEIGHYKKKHILVNILLSSLSMALVLYLMSLFLKFSVFSQAIGIENASFHSGILVFGILFSPISEIAGIFTSMMSRKHEYAADSFAAQFHFGDSLINALKKLTSHNMVSLTPHPWFVFFNYSHPPLLQRINNINKFKGNS